LLHDLSHMLQDSRQVLGIFWVRTKFPLSISLLKLLTLTELINYKFYICVYFATIRYGTKVGCYKFEVFTRHVERLAE
jgi:hypothetical protein